MTNYNFRPPTKPCLPQQYEFTQEMQERIKQRKAERKALLEQIQEQRKKAYQELRKKQKSEI